MPIYEYQCDGCGQVFEILQKYSDPAPTKHDCGSDKVHRIMSTTAFVFKGDGWYITDYSRKDKARAEKAKESKESKSSESSSSSSSSGSDSGSSGTSSSTSTSSESKKSSAAA